MPVASGSETGVVTMVTITQEVKHKNKQVYHFLYSAGDTGYYYPLVWSLLLASGFAAADVDPVSETVQHRVYIYKDLTVPKA
jgi:hypothetical protein